MEHPSNPEEEARREKAREAFDRFVRARDSGEEISPDVFLAENGSIADLLRPLMVALDETDSVGATAETYQVTR